VPVFSSPAIVLRRADYGDYDLIVTLFTQSEGKLAVIAKAAKKSTRRFSGVLELFSFIDAVCRRGKGMPVLQEANLVNAHPGIRTDFKKTAYAGYWTEVVHAWSEEGHAQPVLFRLLAFVLDGLDRREMPEEVLSLIFQIRFLKLAGMQPNLTHCRGCRTPLEDMPGSNAAFELAKGALVCDKCKSTLTPSSILSKGLLKQLQWMADADLDAVRRIRWTPTAQEAAGRFLETFVPLHLGKPLRSLKVLKQLR